jgi:hypothetical protein
MDQRIRAKDIASNLFDITKLRLKNVLPAAEMSLSGNNQ